MVLNRSHIAALATVFFMAGCGGGSFVGVDRGPSVPEALSTFRAALRDPTTDCSTLYRHRNDARAAGANERQQDRLNKALHGVGCSYSTSTRKQVEASPSPSPSPRPRRSHSSQPQGDEARIRQLCRAFYQAVRESAGPPLMNDAEAARLFDELAKEAIDTPLHEPIKDVADGFRYGRDFIDSGPVTEHCD